MKSILEFQERKIQKQKISMLTCYDYSFARLLSATDIDCLLVGDSLAMTMLGHKTTLNVSTDIMALHVESVVRGAPNKLVIGDLPFLSYRKDLNENINAVEKIMKAGAQAVKLEGAAGNLDLVRHLVDSGVPVMGHIGLTPQSVHQLGGFKVQGRDEKAQARLLEHAQQLQDAGCFSIVLEAVPTALATQITNSLEIPTIGIGAGPYTDGQVLVLQDMLGMNPDFKPKFVKTFFEGASKLQEAFNRFHHEVQAGEFPTEKESYS